MGACSSSAHDQQVSRELPEKYKGKRRNGKRHGSGRLVFPNGDIFMGEFHADVREGPGRLVLNDGTVYQGTWVNDELVGEVNIQFADGGSYEGQLASCQMHGKGARVLANGDKYTGEFSEGVFHGAGTLVENGDVLEGMFSHGYLEGDGTKTCSNGSVYVGSFCEGKPHGEGKLTGRDGSVFEGGFREGQMSGKGTLTEPKGKIWTSEHWTEGGIGGSGQISYPKGDRKGRLNFSGEFKNSKMHGPGLLKYSNGDEMQTSLEADIPKGNTEFRWVNGDVFRGTFSNWKLAHGCVEYKSGDRFDGELNDLLPSEGVWTGANGNTYRGPFVRGLRHGHGILSYSGYIYEGEFAEGARTDGSGKMTLPDGTVYSGDWKSEKWCGMGTLTAKSGNNYSGQWAGDRQHGHGVMEWYVDADGRTLEKPERFEGEWIKGECQGFHNIRLAAIRLSSVIAENAERECKSEIEQLTKSQQNICQLCRKEQINTCFLECAHCLACLECSKDLKSCPKCDQLIDRVVRTYET
eukprot:218927_1